MNNTHQFALYSSSFSGKLGHTNILTDEALVGRIKNVLRLAVGERLILFNQEMHALVEIQEITKKAVTVSIVSSAANRTYKPSITLALPLLKKDSFEQALYAATEMGITHIQLLATAKTSHSWQEKDKERALRIIIAAAEQSKNFSFPTLTNPLALEKYLSSLSPATTKLFFDPQGIPLSTLLPSLTASIDCVVFVGPEGDLTDTEKEVVKKAGFTFCALTPTILRSCQAVALVSGIIRSWFLQK